jgi:anti-anti-sigma factor
MKEEKMTQENTPAVLQPEGDIVSAFLPALRSRLRDLVNSGVRQLTVDLVHVQMVDSAGLGLLIAAHNSLKKVGGELAVIHASDDLLSLFKSMRIHQHFKVSGGR